MTTYANMVLCLPVEVYKFPLGDCTNGGVSCKNKTLYLECPHGFVKMDPSDPRCLRLVKRNIMGREYMHVESYCGKAAIFADEEEKYVGPMAGGNFVYTSDSRFPAQYPLAIHDRYETREQYDLYSH